MCVLCSLIMIVLFFLLTVLVTYSLVNLIKHIQWRNRAMKMTAKIPGPKTWPIIGNAPLLINITKAEDLFKMVNSLYNEYRTHPHKIVKFWIGTKLLVCLGDPKHIEVILSSPDALQKDDIYNIITLVGTGLFTRNGQEWRHLRKPLDKLLTKKMIESNLEMFHEKALKLCKVINKHAVSGKCFDFRPYATNYSADTVTVSNFGYDLNELEREENNLYGVFEKLECAIIKLLMFPPYHISSLYAKLSSDGRQLVTYARSYWNLSSKMLQHRLNERTKLGEKIDAKADFYSDVIIQEAKQHKLTWEETGKMATDFLIAGFDTSAVTISYVLLMLAIFPEHQKAVYQEQLDILGDDPEVAPTWEQLSKMAYLTRIIKEVMRLFCPPAVLRKLTGDIDIGEYILPKGCTIIISFYALHRDTKLWSRPNEFYPDHFLPEAVAARPKGTYFPFSWGPRSCPGSVYAMATNKIIASAAIRKYIFETDLTFDKLEYKYSVLLEVSHGYMVRIKPRN